MITYSIIMWTIHFKYYFILTLLTKRTIQFISKNQTQDLLVLMTDAGV